MTFNEAKAIGSTLVEKLCAQGLLSFPQCKRDLTASVMLQIHKPRSAEEIASTLRIRRDQASAVVCKLVRQGRARCVSDGSPRRYVAV